MISTTKNNLFFSLETWDISQHVSRETYSSIVWYMLIFMFPVGPFMWLATPLLLKTLLWNTAAFYVCSMVFIWASPLYIRWRDLETAKRQAVGMQKDAIWYANLDALDMVENLRRDAEYDKAREMNFKRQDDEFKATGQITFPVVARDMPLYNYNYMYTQYIPPQMMAAYACMHTRVYSRISTDTRRLFLNAVVLCLFVLAFVLFLPSASAVKAQVCACPQLNLMTAKGLESFRKEALERRHIEFLNDEMKEARVQHALDPDNESWKFHAFLDLESDAHLRCLCASTASLSMSEVGLALAARVEEEWTESRQEALQGSSFEF